MDLTLSDLSALRGPQAKHDLSLSIVRELNAGDMELLASGARAPAQVPVLRKLRHSHHLLARMLAEGHSDHDAALLAGYGTGRVSLLKNDPAFQDLMAHYKAQVEAKDLDVRTRLSALGLSSLDELQERLEVEPDRFTLKQLLELAEFCLDRSLTQNSAPAKGGGLSLEVKFISAAGAEAKPQDIIDLVSEEIK